MGPHITAVNYEVMQFVNLCSFNPFCDEVVLASIEARVGGSSLVLKLHES